MDAVRQDLMTDEAQVIGVGTSPLSERVSGGSSSSVRATTGWSTRYVYTAKRWKELFANLRGTLPASIDQLGASIYVPSSKGGDIRANSRTAFAVALRMLQVTLSLCNVDTTIMTEAELTSRIWLLIRCIQACNVSNHHRVIQSRSEVSEDSGEEHAVQSAAAGRSKASEGQHEAASEAQLQDAASDKQQLHNPTPGAERQPDQKSITEEQPHVSGCSGSLEGLEGAREEERLKLDGATIIPDLTITNTEDVNNATTEITIVTMEVKLGKLTRSHLRQSVCQGICAGLRERLRGSMHRTRSILINETSMIVVEYGFDDDFIEEEIQKKRRAADIPTNEIKGEFQVIYTGPFQLDLSNVTAREVFVGLIAPSFRSFIDLASLQANLPMQLQAGAEHIVTMCKSNKFDVPKELVPQLKTFPVANASWKAWLVGELPEASTKTATSMEELSAPKSRNRISDTVSIPEQRLMAGDSTTTTTKSAKVPSSKRKRDNDLASDRSPSKAHNTTNDRSELDAAMKAASEAGQRRDDAEKEWSEAVTKVAVLLSNLDKATSIPVVAPASNQDKATSNLGVTDE